MARTPADFECQEYAIPVAGRTLRLLGPKYPHALNQDPEVLRRSQVDGYKPFWAQPWPAAVMLAEHVLAHIAPQPKPLLELGAGLGTAGLALAMAGHRVIATDYDEEALGFIRASAALNQVRLADTRPLDWRSPPPEQYALIIASDVAYDPANHAPLARFLAQCLTQNGQAFVSDLNRRAADDFPAALHSAGFQVDSTPARAQAIAAFDAIDGRILDGRVFRISKA